MRPFDSTTVEDWAVIGAYTITGKTAQPLVLLHAILGAADSAVGELIKQHGTPTPISGPLIDPHNWVEATAKGERLGNVDQKALLTYLLGLVPGVQALL
jgi:hypothetical protein